jgi:hypothetical protein
VNGWLNITGGGPRIVAAPWEREIREGQRSTWVGIEDCVSPEIGPVDLYRSRWPERFVVWNRSRQLFEIRSFTDAGWREFVFEYDAPPDPDGMAIETDQLAQMVVAGDPTVRRVFRDFDYAFVRRRLIEAMEFDEMNRSSARLTDSIMEANRKLDKKRIKDVAARQAARMGEIRRYLPRLIGEEKIPLVPGANFTH